MNPLPVETQQPRPMHRAEDRLPLTAAQLGIWIGQQLDPANPAYWTAEAIHLHGQLQRSALLAAIREVLGEAASLQLRFEQDGAEVWQRVAAQPWSVTEADFGHETDALAAATRWMEQDLRQRPDLQAGPLFACALLRLSPSHHVWYLRVHHISLDGYGHALLASRLAARYEANCQQNRQLNSVSMAVPGCSKHAAAQAVVAAGEATQVATETAFQAATEIVIQTETETAKQAMAALVAEDIRYQASAARRADQAFWLAKLQHAAPPTLLAAPAPLAHAVRREQASVSASEMVQWQTLASRHTLDRGMLLQAALLAWLAQTSGQPVLRCGIPQMLRLGSCTVDLPCMAMNIVPLLLKVNQRQSLLHLAGSLTAELASMRRHQRYRHEHMKQEVGAVGEFNAVREPIAVGDINGMSEIDLPGAINSGAAIGGERTFSRSRRLFGVVINWMPFERPARFGALRAQSLTVASGPVEDLAIKLEPQHDGSLHLTLEANPNAYTAVRLQSLLASLLTTLAHALAQPEVSLQALPRAPGAECLAILRGPDLPAPAVDVMQAIQAQARHHPQHIALLHNDIAISYEHLLRQVHSVAGQLQASGAGTNTLIACLLPRSPVAIIAMLATLAAGAAFLPLDPAGPPARIASVLAQARPLLGIAAPSDAARFAPHCRILTLQPPANGNHVLSRDAVEGLNAANTPGGRTLATASTSSTAVYDALAYVIYTSGSTGQPNGVMIGRAALAHFVAAIGQLYLPGPHDRVLQFAPLHFDACIEEIFGALCHGATLVLRNDSMLDSLPGFMQVCASLEITVLDLPTAFWHELTVCLSAGQTSLPDSVRQVIIGGEAALPGHLARWRASVPAHVVLHNTYGPTETTVICSSAQLAGTAPAASPSPTSAPDTSVPAASSPVTSPPAASSLVTSPPAASGFTTSAPIASGTNTALDAGTPQPLPIGCPLPGVMLAILDANDCPCPPGFAGQLMIAGPTLAHGYLDQAQTSAQRFRAIPALPQAARWYQSGDRVVLAADGELRYLGRIDDEIKISGHRIDPLEIETALMQYPGVAEAALVAWRLPPLENRTATTAWHLAAFLVTCPDSAGLQTSLANDLRAFLAHRLPAAALPARYVQLPRLPRNRNGKIDRAALRQQAQLEHTSQGEGDAADATAATIASPLEQRIMAVWREILGIAATPQDDFFLLGGKSLQAIQCANRLSLSLQREVAVSTLFRHPTLAQLAHALEQLPAGNDASYPSGTSAAINPAMPAAATDADRTLDPPSPSAGTEFAPLLAIQPGTGPTLFCLHPAEGLSWCYLGLAAHLPDMPMVGLQARGMLGELPTDIDAMLGDYLALIRHTQPHGPYYLLGWSSGGGIAHALATRLQALGHEVGLLALMDAYPSDIWHGKPPPTLRDALVALLDVVGASEFDATGQPLPAPALLQALLAPGSTLAHVGEAQLQRIAHCALHTMQIYRDLQHQPFNGDMLFFHALQRKPDAPDWRGWQPYVRGQIERIDIDSNHNGMSLPAPLAHIGRVLANKLHSLAAQSRQYQQQQHQLEVE